MNYLNKKIGPLDNLPLHQFNQPGNTILFHGGPFDGKVYSGGIPSEKYGFWEEEIERLNGTIVQIVHHCYEFTMINDKLAWRFIRTNEGEMIPLDSPMERIGPRKRRDKV